MKFKKTKLTALAMSVLMAASTITSVTWAADLFTDGAPAEVAVEAPVEVVSDGEVEEVSEEVDGSLLTATVTYDDPEYDRYGVVYDQSAKEGNQYYLLNVTVKVNDDPNMAMEHFDKVFVTPTETVVPADCKHGELVLCEFSMHGKPYTAYYERGEADTNHNNKGVLTTVEGSFKIEKNNDDIPCNDYAIYVEYYYCSGCNGIRLKGGTYATMSDSDIKDQCDAYLKNEKDQTVTIEFTKITNYTASHKWNIKGKTVIPPDNVAGERRSQDIALTRADVQDYVTKKNLPAGTFKCNNVFDYLVATAKGEYEKLANCKIDSNGQIAGQMLEDQDAYFYNYEQCSLCGETRTTGNGKEVFYHANMTEGQRFYEMVKGIRAFVTKNADGSLSLYGYNALTGRGSSTIPENLFYDVVLEDCTKPGTYNLCVMTGSNGTGSTIIKKDLVKSGHTMKRIELDEEESDTDDLAQDAGGFILDRDENYNVTGAYSKDCSTEAAYELKHECFNEDYSDISVTGKKKAAAGPHVWVDRELNPFKIDYKQVDALHHIEHYYDDVTCDVCKKTDVVDSTTTLDALKVHTFAPAEIKDSRVEPTCGETGSYKRGDTCPCGLVDESTITTVTIPATDKHDFGTNEAYIYWTGEVFIKNSRTVVPSRNINAYVVRKCNVCGKLDSNGINTITPSAVAPSLTAAIKSEITKTAKKDPSTGVTYPCATDLAKLTVEWVGIVDGKVVNLTSTKEDVPYYATVDEYDGRTAHHKAPAVKENVTPTSYDEVIYCEVCGDEISRKTITLTPETQIQAPTVTATAVNYNTVNVSWTPVEGATSYRLYYRSADLGITTWHRVRTLKGTSFTHSGLTTGARYRYTVRAEVNGKLGDYSRTGSVARPLPAAPEMKSVTAVSNGTRVTWSKVDGADGYIIFRKTPTGTFTRVGSVSKGSKVTWTDKKAVSGSIYKVRAYRTVDNVNYKGAFSATM